MPTQFQSPITGGDVFAAPAAKTLPHLGELMEVVRDVICDDTLTADNVLEWAPARLATAKTAVERFNQHARATALDWADKAAHIQSAQRRASAGRSQQEDFEQGEQLSRYRAELLPSMRQAMRTQSALQRGFHKLVKQQFDQVDESVAAEKLDQTRDEGARLLAHRYRVSLHLLMGHLASMECSLRQHVLLPLKGLANLLSSGLIDTGDEEETTYFAKTYRLVSPLRNACLQISLERSLSWHLLSYSVHRAGDTSLLMARRHRRDAWAFANALPRRSMVFAGLVDQHAGARRIASTATNPIGERLAWLADGVVADAEEVDLLAQHCQAMRGALLKPWRAALLPLAELYESLPKPPALACIGEDSSRCQALSADALRVVLRPLAKLQYALHRDLRVVAQQQHALRQALADLSTAKPSALLGSSEQRLFVLAPFGPLLVRGRAVRALRVAMSDALSKSEQDVRSWMNLQVRVHLDGAIVGLIACETPQNNILAHEFRRCVALVDSKAAAQRAANNAPWPKRAGFELP